MNYPFIKSVKSEEETTKIALEFAGDIKAGDVIVLNGNLGAGKTFFVKQALKRFNINNVSSPTFALVNEYTGTIKVYHFDFYRINSSGELFDIGYNDYLNDKNALLFIEWGNLIPAVIPGEKYEINILLKEDFKREIKIEKYS